MSAVFSLDELSSLRDAVKKLLSKERFIHTLGVEQAAECIGERVLPERISELRAAALLHDVTKCLTKDEHFRYIRLGNVKLTDEDYKTVNAYHSFSAPGFIKENLPLFSTQDILDAVFNHTLGAPDMNLFSTVIFIADYVEEGRQYDDCRKVREFLYNALKKSFDKAGAIRALRCACVMSIEYTEHSLALRGIEINSKTIITKNSLKAMI